MRRKKPTPKPRKAAFAVQVPIYDVEVLVLVNLKEKDYQKVIQSRWGFNLASDVTDDSLGRLLDFDNGRYILMLDNFEGTAKQRGFLAHEIFHAGSCILRRAGLKLEVASEEAFAYLNGFLTEQIYHGLKG